MKAAPAPYSPAELAEAKRLLEAGRTADEAARLLGRPSGGALRQAARRHRSTIPARCGGQVKNHRRPRA